jgi:putative ABC transport system permease protein
VSLAIGVAANTTIFSAADVFLYRPLPYPDPDRLVQVWSTNEQRGWDGTSISMPDYLDWRAGARTIDLAAYYGQALGLSGGAEPERVEAVRVSSNFFDVIGIGPARGRTFRADEEAAGADNAVILSHGLWTRRFAADPGVIGGTITVDGVPRAVVGVMPEDFEFPSASVELWAPLAQTGREPRDSRWLRVIGRIQSGASLDAARSELAATARRLADTHPLQNANMGVRILTLEQELFDEDFWTAAMICTVAVGFVLLIACANIANLLLARASARDREMAVRTVLGAGRWRIVRQLLAESLVLALVGGALGLLLSVWGIRWLVSIMPPSTPFMDRIGIDARVLLFTLAITIASGLLFGLVPALQSARPDLAQSLREAGGRGASAGGRRGRFRSGLVVAEIGLALALLIAAGLLIRSYVGLQRVELGFRPQDTVTARVSLLAARYPDSVRVASMYEQLESRLAAVPGIDAVGATTVLPMFGSSGTYYALEGSEPADPAERPVAEFRGITPGYLAALGIPLRAGRAFTARDRLDSPPVLLVNEAFAARHWPDGGARAALGARVVLSSGAREIVGVVGDTRDFGPDDDAPPIMYIPALQRGYRELAFVVHSGMDPGAAVSAMRAEVSALDPDLPLYSVSTMPQVIERALSGDTVMFKLLSAFGAFALVLAILGVYGVMAYSVTQRTQELGIRLALGAQRGDIVRMIVRQAGLLTALGVGAGLVVALATARQLSAFLHGVSPFDLATFLFVPAALAAAALLAAFVPARRATRIDPVDALRYD